MSYQQLTIVGNIGNDPEMRFTPSGVAVTSFSVAVNKSWTNQDGAKQEKVTWFRVSCWRKLAETMSKYAVKGQLVLITGEIEEARVFADKKTGDARASLEITANAVRFIGARPHDEDEEEVAVAPAKTKAKANAPSLLADEDIPF